jgi:F-type H+-transporting ATPase subunit b
MPQFDFGYWPGQIIWLLITFVVLYILLSAVILPRVRGTLDAREDRIAGDIGEARRLRDLAAADAKAAEGQIAEARARAHRTAAEAKAKAAAEARQRQTLLEAELGERLARAEVRIRASRDEAMGNVRGIAEDTAAAIVEKLTAVASDAAGHATKA